MFDYGLGSNESGGRGLDYLSKLSQSLGGQVGGSQTSPSNYVFTSSMNSAPVTRNSGFDFGSLLTKDNIGMGIGALQGLGNLYMGFQSLDAMNKQNKFNRSIANRNLANASKITNASLEDRAISKATGQGIEGAQLDAFVKDYLNKYKQDGTSL